MIKLKFFLIAIFIGLITSSCVTLIIQATRPAFTDKQCEVVRENFEKLKIGMTKDEIFPLIGGKRPRKIIRNPGQFSEQKTKWEIYPLCYDLESCIIKKSEKKVCYEWQMIAFDTETNKVIKIFSEEPDIF